MEVNMNFLAVSTADRSTNTNRQSNNRDTHSTSSNDFKNELNNASSEISNNRRTADEKPKDNVAKGTDNKNSNAEKKLNNNDEVDTTQESKDVSKTEKAEANDSNEKSDIQKDDKIGESAKTADDKPTIDDSKDNKDNTAVNSVLQELLVMLQSLDLSSAEKQEDKQMSNKDKIEALDNVIKKLEMLLTKMSSKLNNAASEVKSAASTDTDKLKQLAVELKQLVEKLNNNNTVQQGVSNQNQSNTAELSKQINAAADGIVKDIKDIIDKTKQITYGKEKKAEADKVQTQTDSPKMVKDLRLNFNNQRYKVQPVNASEADEAETASKAVDNSKAVNQNSTEGNSSTNIAAGIQKTEIKLTSDDNNTNNNFAVKLDNIQKEADIKAADTAIDKAEKKLEAPKTEIINQVIKKAEVLLKDGKSEMNIKLEPEHLGKLSLKIEVDRGVVTAKFVAENQQVKNELESNFNQLKSMLQDKGISVQSFSVSVGHEGKEFNSKNNLNIWKEKLKDSNKRLSLDDFVELDSVISDRRINPYIYHDGTVDYKA